MDQPAIVNLSGTPFPPQNGSSNQLAPAVQLILQSGQYPPPMPFSMSQAQSIMSSGMMLPPRTMMPVTFPLMMPYVSNLPMVSLPPLIPMAPLAPMPLAQGRSTNAAVNSFGTPFPPQTGSSYQLAPAQLVMPPALMWPPATMSFGQFAPPLAFAPTQSDLDSFELLLLSSLALLQQQVPLCKKENTIKIGIIGRSSPAFIDYLSSNVKCSLTLDTRIEKDKWLSSVGAVPSAKKFHVLMINDRAPFDIKLLQQIKEKLTLGGILAVPAGPEISAEMKKEFTSVFTMRKMDLRLSSAIAQTITKISLAPISCSKKFQMINKCTMTF